MKKQKYNIYELLLKYWMTKNAVPCYGLKNGLIFLHK